ncbi:MAG TPA: PQQ-binding-like beta-propeller repeat protein [Planctomycetota bacterium]|nr:PQQ-binding-like beta-propeller repeat protein [Planctomycetota bacterium]
MAEIRNPAWARAACLLAACGLLGFAGEGERAGPSFATTYQGYRPDFAAEASVLARWKAEPDGAPDWLKFSTQATYDNRAYLEQDWRVPPIVKRADELMARGECREAMGLYQHAIEKYPNDLWPVAEHGIFVPTTLYCQRQLLKLPKKELDYYRTVYDPYAKALFDKAKEHYSPLDFADVAVRYCATTYGSLALFELGNAALDAGNFELARTYYERIGSYHRLTPVSPDELTLRLLKCSKRLGDEKAYAELKRQIKPAAGSPEMRNYLQELDAYRPEAPGGFSQRASPDALSLSDYTLFEPLAPDISNYDSTWAVRRELGWRFRHPDNLIPVVAGNNLLYKDKNIVYCRSVLTGDLKWEYAEGGLVWDFERTAGGPWSGRDEYPYQDLVVHDGMVYTFIVRGGPSLVALDLVTGERRWAAGPMAAASKAELDDRYAARPAVGGGRVYATVVHDDIEGDSHLSSTVSVAAFEGRGGKLLWRRTLCRLTPGKFTISRLRRKIRIFCSPPAYANGVVYACTNAGVFAALDAETGEARWITRYDQNPVTLDATVLPEAHSHKLFCSNTAPIVFGPYLLAMAVDNSARLYCLDRFTGRVVWSRVGEGHALRLVGVWRDQVIVGGSQYLCGWDIATGRPRFKTQLVESGAEFRRGMQAIGRDGKIHSSGWYVSGTEQYYYDVVVDITAEPTVVGRRAWYNDFARGSNEQRVKKGLKPLVNEDPFFLTKSRMGLRLWDVPCEVEVDARKITMKYDVEKVRAALAKAEGLQASYDRAELHQFAGRRDEAIAEFEALRARLPEGRGGLRIEVSRQLFGLYTRQAQAALRAGDNQEVEKAIARMATCCTASRQEIQTVLAMAEVFARKGEHDHCATCLRAILRHYGDVYYPVSSLVTGAPEALVSRATEVLGHLVEQSPRHFFDREFGIAGRAMLRSVPNYFSLIAPLEPDSTVKTGQFANGWLRRVLPTTSPDYRRGYEDAAKAAFGGHGEPTVLEQLIGEFPATASAQAALDQMLAEADKLPVPARNVRRWQLEELAQLNGLKFDPARTGGAITVKHSAPAPLAGAYRDLTHKFEFGEKTTLRLLERRGDRAEGEDLLLLGMRSKQVHAVKHGLLCFDAAAGKVRWTQRELRLESKGEEPGFAEAFVHKGLAIVHGRADVLAFRLEDGRLAWQFRVPHEFEIESMTPADDLFVLSGRFVTLAIHYADGSLVWEAHEQGELYCPPVVAEATLATVRLNPSGVSFRSLPTGRLVVHLDIPGLLQNFEHPILGPAAPGLPVAFAKGLLVLTDGWDYIGVDTRKRSVRWRIRIENVDRDQVLPYRLWVSRDNVLALKQEYDIPAVEMFDAATGERLWGSNQGGAGARPAGRKREGAGTAFYSAVWDEKCIYGLTHRPDRTAVDLVGHDRPSGARALEWHHGSFEHPEIFLCPEPYGDVLVARVKDRQNWHALVAFDKKATKLIHELKVKGFGLWGNYGEMSWAVQGKTLAILSKDVLTYSRPEEAKVQ